METEVGMSEEAFTLRTVSSEPAPPVSPEGAPAVRQGQALAFSATGRTSWGQMQTCASFPEGSHRRLGETVPSGPQVGTPGTQGRGVGGLRVVDRLWSLIKRARLANA